MNEQLIKQFEAIVSPNGLLQGKELSLRATDPFGISFCQSKLLIRPINTDELSQVMKLCHQHKQPVVTHGGLTGLVGGASTTAETIVISLERMNKIEEIDSQQRTMTVQAGVPLQTVQEQAEEQALYYPIDLGARGSATIGGTIATNAGGNRVVRYGMTRESVLGLEVVLADGTVITSMSKVVKNNAGYNLPQIFIGSEGTLGIVTRAVLRLRTKPKGEATTLVALKDFHQLSHLLTTAETELAGGLSSFEVMWHSFYKLVTDSPRHTPPISQEYPYYVIIESQGRSDTEEQDKLLAMLEVAFEQKLIADAVLSQSSTEKEKIWAIRDDVETLMQLSPLYAFDISLPTKAIPSYLEKLQQQLDSIWHKNHCVVFGHLGDGNLHIIISAGTPKDKVTIEEFVYGGLKGLQGSISAEHGIGLEKINYLKYTRTDNEIKLMATIKRALDPMNLLNPGKVIPQP
ncbi:MAG: FAD-binding oxidoreductase [Colwellia sp.]